MKRGERAELEGFQKIGAHECIRMSDVDGEDSEGKKVKAKSASQDQRVHAGEVAYEVRVCSPGVGLRGRLDGMTAAHQA